VSGRPRHPALVILFSLVVTGVDALLLALALGGFGALFHNPRALALLGVWAVTGMTLALLHPVRAQDRVVEARDPAWRLFALLLVPMAIPPVAAWGERAGLLPLPGGPALRWAGIVVVAVGLTVRIAAMATLGNRFAPIPAVQREHPLETRGLYATVRHPGYLGAWLAALGAMITFGNNLALPLVVVFAALLAARVRDEERLLERHLGAPWLDYRRRTGAFLPRFGTPRQS
jgi:protein-S-isoprenylcysteine O-methyltransferase Ste14